MLVAFESQKLTLSEHSYLPHLLELLAVVHHQVHQSFRLCSPYLLDKPFELHTDNASLQWLHHVSRNQACWLNLLAEYQYSVVHIPGRTNLNPADFLMHKRLLDGTGPALSTGYEEHDSALELNASSAAPPAAAFVHRDSDPPPSFTRAHAPLLARPLCSGPSRRPPYRPRGGSPRRCSGVWAGGRAVPPDTPMPASQRLHALRCCLRVLCPCLHVMRCCLRVLFPCLHVL
jgi:hypothetical protein